VGHKSKKSKRWSGVNIDPMRQYVPRPAFLPTAQPADLDRILARHEELRFRIASDCKVSIQFNGLVTQSALRKLINYLELSVADFPGDADPSPAQD
jgi:hypothetical protein